MCHNDNNCHEVAAEEILSDNNGFSIVRKFEKWFVLMTTMIRKDFMGKYLQSACAGCIKPHMYVGEKDKSRIISQHNDDAMKDQNLRKCKHIIRKDLTGRNYG